MGSYMICNFCLWAHLQSIFFSWRSVYTLDGGGLPIGQFCFCLCQIHMVSLVSWVLIVGWCEFSPTPAPRADWGFWLLMGAFFLLRVHGEHPVLQRGLFLPSFWLWVPLPTFCCVQALRFQLLSLEMWTWACSCLISRFISDTRRFLSLAQAQMPIVKI